MEELTDDETAFIIRKQDHNLPEGYSTLIVTKKVNDCPMT